jgi:hypothetical protein
MSLILQSSGGGQITVQEPATASNFTQTLPAATGTVMVSGNQPAFSAWQSSAQTLSNATFTKMLFQTEEFDTNNNFDTSTSRFTPTVAGYYQVSSQVYFGNSLGPNITAIFKNGGAYKRLQTSPNPANDGTSGGSCIVYCNGTTDYIEVFGYQNRGSSLTLPFPQADLIWFQGVLVRAE